MNRRCVCKWAATTSAVLALFACTKSAPDEGTDKDNAPDEQGGQSGQALNEFLGGLGHFELPPSVSKTEIACDDALCADNSTDPKVACTYRAFTETAHFESFVALSPNSATLWPGNVVRGDDARAGLITPVGVSLSPVTFSVSLENLNGVPSATMDVPSLSAFRQARQQVFATDVDGATAASLKFEVEQVSSASQLSVVLGAGVDWPGSGEIAGSFDFSSSSETTKLVVNFVQAYYTIDVDTKPSPASYFAPETTVKDVSPFVSPESPPLYVQSITYGRRVVFTVETDVSAAEIAAALEAAYAGVVDANVNVQTAHKQMLAQSKIQAFVLGGDGEAAASGVVAGYEGLADFIKTGGNYSKDSPGAPIGYKLAYLDNAATKLAFTTEYAEKTCHQTQGTLTFSLASIEHLAGGEGPEVYGSVSIRYPQQNNPVISCTAGGQVAHVWDVGMDNWLGIDLFDTWTPASPPTITLPHVAFGEGQNICILTTLFDADLIDADDALGAAERFLPWSAGWSGEHGLTTFGEGGMQMEVRTAVALD